MSDKPSIAFCHGIWADGSGFSKLIPPLRAEGHEVITSQHCLDTTKRTLPALFARSGESAAR
jgi:hypothetical protein